MALVIGAAIVWLALFAALQVALRYHAEPTAEQATIFAKPFESPRKGDLSTELLEFSDSKAG
jgi:hypothetical protein